jgi:cobalt/nickel transport system permease protein
MPVAGLAHDGTSIVHRLPAKAKLLATFAFAFAVVLTPPRSVWAFGVDAVALGAVVGLARLPALVVVRRMRVELPFLAFAALLPLTGSGWWATWNIVAKATLGVVAAIVLSSTTPVTELLAGLRRLRVPPVLVGITAFMVRYLDVIVAEADRMRVARLSRADDPRWLWQARGAATSAGALFVRSYERGERVELAMRARGFTGVMPDLHERGPESRAWAAALLPVVACASMLGARLW